MVATQHQSKLESAFLRYKTALLELEQAKKQYKTPKTLKNSHLLDQYILEALVSRDLIQAAFNEEKDIAVKHLTHLIDLDESFKILAKCTVQPAQIEAWQKSFNPPETAWWWHFEFERHPLDRFDWVWNGLTAGVLVLAGSLTVSIFQAFSVGGLSFEAILGTVAQGAGLAFIGKSALTLDGQQKIKNLLNHLKIQPYLHTEATFSLSLLWLLATYGLSLYLPTVLYNQGVEFYQQGRLGKAESRYLQALKLAPEDTKINTALGLIYESLGAFDQALMQYQKALPEGNAAAFSNLGRVYINRIDPITQKKDPALAETYLRMGLDRIRLQPTNDFNKYQLHTNLGWALLEQDKYQQAHQELTTAIHLSKKPAGIANCLLAKTLENLGDQSSAQQQWTVCQKFQPALVSEYQWMTASAPQWVTQMIDTSSMTTQKALPIEAGQ
jgi:Flp pilus assembly protein TadD